MKIKELNQKLKEVIYYLENNNHLNEAKDLREIFDDIQRGNIDKNIFKAIKERSHTHWLGDLYIAEFRGSYKWFNLLNELHELADNQINK